MNNESKPFFHRFFGHLKTVHQHRSLVRKYCFACGLYWQGLTHDLSKYSLSELIPSVKYYQGYRSPYNREKELYGFSYGWLHHKGRNKHHFEYWYDTMNGVYSPVLMPYKYLIESICDRLAASHIYKKEKYNPHCPLEYYEMTHSETLLHPLTAKCMQGILSMIEKEGEEKTLKAIKQSIQNNKPLFDYPLDRSIYTTNVNRQK